MEQHLIKSFAALLGVITWSLTAMAERSLDGCGMITANHEGVHDQSAFDTVLEKRLLTLLNATAGVPGLAVSVVQDNRLIYARGFGFRDLASCKPLTADTRIYLKSTTKSFTGLLGALLHEDGIIDLDAPITRYLPAFDLPEPLNPDQISLRMHLLHTKPYQNGGVNYMASTYGLGDFSTALPILKTYSTVKDTGFAYSNVGPIVAAYAFEAASGENWRDLIEEWVFEPLGMQSSFAHLSKANKGELATSYAFDDEGQFLPVTTKHEAQLNAAGGAFSTANDLARWMIVNLNNGELHGKDVFPARVMRQTHAPQVQMDWQWSLGIYRYAQGLGVYHADYDGDLLMHHFGGETHVSFMPEHGLGVSVLTNQIAGGAGTSHRVALLIYDYLLGKDGMDTRFDKAETAIKAYVARQPDQRKTAVEKLRQSVTDEVQDFAEEELIGTYQSARLGDIKLYADGRGRFAMLYGVQDGLLVHVSGDAYLADFELWNEPPVLFRFYRDRKTGNMVLDWGGRIFSRENG